MKMRVFMRSLNLIAFAFAMLALAGCGHIHVGSTTHTHIYDWKTIESDDLNASKVGRIMAYIAKVSGEEQPMKGFEWDDEKITDLEKENRKKGKHHENDDKVFEENF
ncbi:hypothetical protein BVX97_01460 [bacterium E08(2017)]|nr:hypothetical protein BVX97_01460 [bacterium E08(2017)]